MAYGLGASHTSPISSWAKRSQKYLVLLGKVGERKIVIISPEADVIGRKVRMYYGVKVDNNIIEIQSGLAEDLDELIHKIKVDNH